VNHKRGRKKKGGEGVETTSITVRVPEPFKKEQIKMAADSGFNDLSGYINKVLDTYTVEVKLKRIERIIAKPSDEN